MIWKPWAPSCWQKTLETTYLHTHVKLRKIWLHTLPYMLKNIEKLMHLRQEFCDTECYGCRYRLKYHLLHENALSINKRKRVVHNDIWMRSIPTPRRSVLLYFLIDIYKILKKIPKKFDSLGSSSCCLKNVGFTLHIPI